MQRKFDDLLLGSIELFCFAAELGSFTLAANAASVTPAAVSRSVARLEELYVLPAHRGHGVA